MATLPAPTSHRFAGTLAAITGAGSGIGRAAALRLAAEGALVACLDIDEGAARATAEAAAGLSVPAWGTRCDITDEDSVARALDDAEERAGRRLGVLVANAGVPGPVGPVPHLDGGELERVVAVNLTGQVLCAKQALPRLAAHGAGAIVFTASHVAFAAVPHWTPYAATKGGVVALARGLAMEHAPEGVRVNCVCPGPVATALLAGGWADAGGDADAAIEGRGRVGTPEEIAAVIAFLASPEAALVTGAALVADGGAAAHMGTSWPSPTYWD
jgi:meso-butanediol dehydrogenase/(S,S)-butanediol dehydrogenase/diacetyl reductase